MSKVLISAGAIKRTEEIIGPARMLLVLAKQLTVIVETLTSPRVRAECLPPLLKPQGRPTAVKSLLLFKSTHADLD